MTSASPYGFVVNRTRAYWVDIPPVVFLLWMLNRVSITLRCGCVQMASVILGGDLKSVLCSDRAHAKGFDGQAHIFGRTGGGSKVVDKVYGARVEGLADIPFLEVESRLIGQMGQVARLAGGEIVNAEDGVAFTQQAVCKVRAKKPGGAGNQYTHGYDSCSRIRGLRAQRP
jgi:hypothetical protein